jgi:sulfate permease family protein
VTPELDHQSFFDPSCSARGWIRGHRWQASLRLDVIAGVSVVAPLIPESLGYAGVAGLPPEVGDLGGAESIVRPPATVNPTGMHGTTRPSANAASARVYDDRGRPPNLGRSICAATSVA